MCLFALTVDGCANRGMQAPVDEETGLGGSVGTGTGGIGAGGTFVTGGTTGAGGATGGTTGSGGATGRRGGTGGTKRPAARAHRRHGGRPEDRRHRRATGTGGTPVPAAATGGRRPPADDDPGGSDGHRRNSWCGGKLAARAGAPDRRRRWTTGTGGAAGAGGKAGASGNVCPAGGVLDCSTTGALKLPDGHVADFSSPEWDSSTAKWCDQTGSAGLFSYSGAAPSAATATVDTTAQNLKLNLTVGATGYAGGGLSFDSCVNASSFTSVQFTATLTGGSLTNCVWQVSCRRKINETPPPPIPAAGPARASNCYRYPAAAGLTFPTATAAAYRERTRSSTIRRLDGLDADPGFGVQWRVNSGVNGAGSCMAELRIEASSSLVAAVTRSLHVNHLRCR